MSERLYTIGEVARLSGVPVKTIRHYSDEGVLPPASVTAAGYRLYGDADRGRLEMIRALRALGFPLPAIAGMLGPGGDAADALRLQLDAVEMQMRGLARQRAVLRAALKAGPGATLATLDRMHALARLTAMERETFLASRFDAGLAEVPMDEAWKARFWAVAFHDLPEEMDEAQLAAWLELASLAADEGFVASIRAGAQPFWEAAAGRWDQAAWDALQAEAFAVAIPAVHAGRPPTDDAAGEVAARYLAGLARMLARENDGDFAAWLLALWDSGDHDRAARFWELVAVVKRWRDVPPYAAAHRWLRDAIRHHATAAGIAS